MKRYIKAYGYDPTTNISQDDVVYIVRPAGKRTWVLDAKDNHKGYTLRHGYNGLVFKTLNEAKSACLKYMASEGIDSNFPRDYFDFYKITYYPNNYYTEEQI